MNDIVTQLKALEAERRYGATVYQRHAWRLHRRGRFWHGMVCDVFGHRWRGHLFGTMRKCRRCWRDEYR